MSICSVQCKVWKRWSGQTSERIEAVLLELEELFENEDVPASFTKHVEAQNEFFECNAENIPFGTNSKY